MAEFGNITCGDCGSPDPQWASLNRGLLLCKECCYVHRSLGPQCSRVKSLKNSQWHPNLKKMLFTLASGSANHVWEHTLLDPSKASPHQPHVKKPGPNDPLEPVKRRFINAKHCLFQFVLRQKPETFLERNQELHSTVRTADLGTTLRLLASGSDPNFFHPEKGTRPLHVAARTGQSLQVELLILHGAQTDAPDYLGQSAVEHALSAGFKELAQRILELRYLLTDYLSYFACNRTPDHSTSKHVLIPGCNISVTKQEYFIRRLKSHVLEQFTADLYDEVDRRQLEKDMIAITVPSSDVPKFSIAFLPVHSQFSSVRNQTRQKFARLADDELGSLITLVLIESKRRHCNDSNDMESDRDIFIHNDARGYNTSVPSGASHLTNSKLIFPGIPTAQIQEDDDFPLYDSVASDEDLVLTEQQTVLAQQRSTLEETSLSSSNLKPVSSCGAPEFRDGPLAVKLSESEAKIKELEESNHTLKMEILVLQRMIGSVINENLELRTNGMLPANSENLNLHVSVPNLMNGHNGSSSRLQGHGSDLQVCKSRPPRPVSLCEPKGEKPVGLPARPDNTEMYLRRKQIQIEEKSQLVQDTTRIIVEHIKVLVECANNTDMDGIQLASLNIYENTHKMATSLLLKESRQDVRNTLESVLFQVLRLKFEMLQLVEANPPQAVLRVRNAEGGLTNKGRATSPSPEIVQKVKHVCFHVGAAFKQLVFNVVQQS